MREGVVVTGKPVNRIVVGQCGVLSIHRLEFFSRDPSRALSSVQQELSPGRILQELPMPSRLVKDDCRPMNEEWEK